MGECTDHIVRSGSSAIGLDDESLVPIGHVDVVLGIPIGITEAALDELGLRGGKVAIGTGEISQRSRTDVGVPGVVEVVGIGQDLDGDALAAGGEVILGLAIDGGSDALGEVAVGKGMAGTDIEDGRALAIEELKNLNLLELTGVAEELELVLNAMVGIDDGLSALNVGDDAVGQGLEGGDDVVAVIDAVNHAAAVEGEGIGDVVLAVSIVKDEGVLSR